MSKRKKEEQKIKRKVKKEKKEEENKPEIRKLEGRKRIDRVKKIPKSFTILK